MRVDHGERHVGASLSGAAEPEVSLVGVVPGLEVPAGLGDVEGQVLPTAERQRRASRSAELS